MKILLSTYSCLPTNRSEPGNAWRAINDLVEDHEVWAVIEETLHGERIRSHLAEHPIPGFHPVFVKGSFRVGRRAEIAQSLHYLLWQKKLEIRAKELHARVGFDLCQHLTFGRYWTPSGLRAVGLPFVWGPVGAAETPPPRFVAELPPRARLFEALRNRTRAQARRSRALLETARAATVGIGVTPETCEALRTLGVKRVEMLPQATLTDEELVRLGSLPSPPPGPLRAICIGRLVHWKGFHLAIRAFARFAAQDRNAELWIVNDGPERRRLEELAALAGVGSQVRFLGRLPTQSEVLDRLARSHVLLHPALHEGFGNVCLEALAAGRPVVCLDIGGPATQATARTGFVAPVTAPEQVVEAISVFLSRIDRDRSLLAAMSHCAKARAREVFGLTRVRRVTRCLYAEAITEHRRGAAPVSLRPPAG